MRVLREARRRRWLGPGKAKSTLRVDLKVLQAVKRVTRVPHAGDAVSYVLLYLILAKESGSGQRYRMFRKPRRRFVRRR